MFPVFPLVTSTIEYLFCRLLTLLLIKNRYPTIYFFYGIVSLSLKGQNIKFAKYSFRPSIFGHCDMLVCVTRVANYVL